MDLAHACFCSFGPDDPRCCVNKDGTKAVGFKLATESEIEDED